MLDELVVVEGIVVDGTVVDVVEDEVDEDDEPAVEPATEEVVDVEVDGGGHAASVSPLRSSAERQIALEIVRIVMPYCIAT